MTYFDSAGGRLVAVWMHARVTANASSAMISAPISRIHGWSCRRLPRPNRGAALDGRCGGRRSYIACIAGDAPTGSCGGPQPP